MLVAEQELVALVRLGLSDSRIMGCVEHGFKKLSAVELFVFTKFLERVL